MGVHKYHSLYINLRGGLHRVGSAVPIYVGLRDLTRVVRFAQQISGPPISDSFCKDCNNSDNILWCEHLPSYSTPINELIPISAGFSRTVNPISKHPS